MKKLYKKEDLERFREEIISLVNNDPLKSVLFLVNPILALKDEGFDINEYMTKYIKRHLKYRYSDQKTYNEIKENLNKPEKKISWIKKTYFKNMDV